MSQDEKINDEDLAAVEEFGASVIVVDADHNTIDIVDVHPDLRMEGGVEEQSVYDIQNNAKDRRAWVRIQGPIGGPLYSEEFLRELDAKASSAKYIDLVINSTGGSVFGATQIYNALVRHPAQVRVKIEGVAASAATLIAMAGDEIEIAENATFMIHEARPTVKSLESMAELVSRANSAIKKTYAARTGLALEKLDEIFAQGKDIWLSAEEAKEMGFVDKITSLKAVKPSTVPTNTYEDDVLNGFEYEDAIQLLNEMTCRFEPEAEPVSVVTEQEPEAELALALTASADSTSAPDESEASNESEQVEPVAQPEEPASEPEPQQPVALSTGTLSVFEKWLQAQLSAEEIAGLTPEQRASWEDVYNSTVSDEVSEPVAETPIASFDEPVSNVEALRAEAVAFLKRQSEIVAKCGEFKDLAADAIANDWSDDVLDTKLELAQLRQEAAEAKAALEAAATTQEDPGFGGHLGIHTNRLPDNATQDDVIECAFALAMDIPETKLVDPIGDATYEEQLSLGLREINSYDERVVDAARKMSGFGLQQLMSHCAGHRGIWRGEETIEASLGFPTNSFSSARFPKVLEQVVIRGIATAYNKAPVTWNQVAAPMSVDNFKEHMMYKTYGTGPWSPIECGESLKHGILDANEQHRIQIMNHGQVLSICEEHLVNQDLGVIRSFIDSMAMQGRFAPEYALWELISTDATAGAGGVFDFTDPAALEAMWVSFCTAIENGDPNDTTGKPGRSMALDLEPSLLVYNKVNEMKVRRLLEGNPTVAAMGLEGASAADFRTAHLLNTFAGLFSTVKSSLYTDKQGCSFMTAPNLAPAYKVAFLNGRQLPTIRRLPAPNNKLGIDLQGKLPFGVASTDSFLRVSSRD